MSKSIELNPALGQMTMIEVAERPQFASVHAMLLTENNEVVLVREAAFNE